MVSPRYRRAIAEHSICQPGRPLPQGDSQNGSPGFADFAGRIYGYVDKAHISKQEVRAMEEKIRRFV